MSSTICRSVSTQSVSSARPAARSSSAARRAACVRPAAALVSRPIPSRSGKSSSCALPCTTRRLGRAASVVASATTGTGKGDLEMVTITDGDDFAEVYTFGGVCTSWVKGGKDVLYVRPDAVFDKSKPISGGIPHCWPQFGPGDMQTHGFARNVQWELTDTTDSSCTMTLLPSDYTKEMWPYDFKVTQAITLKDGELVAAMEVTNTDSKDFEFTGSFHTYFACTNISDVGVKGLGGLTVLDRLSNTESTASGTVAIDGPVDSVYSNATTNPLTLDVGGGRVVSIGYQNWPDVVVWSPWTDMKACYQEFVCVENAACSPVKVAAGATWSGSMTLTTNVTDPIDTMCNDNPEADECRVYSD